MQAENQRVAAHINRGARGKELASERVILKPTSRFDPLKMAKKGFCVVCDPLSATEAPENAAVCQRKALKAYI
jgi:hypothetical protein